jgi:hypothetical protein
MKNTCVISLYSAEKQRREEASEKQENREREREIIEETASQKKNLFDTHKHLGLQCRHGCSVHIASKQYNLIALFQILKKVEYQARKSVSAFLLIPFQRGKQKFVTCATQQLQLHLVDRVVPLIW